MIEKNKEFVFQYKNQIISYDSGPKDCSCMMFAKKENDKMIIIGELKNESADLVSNLIQDRDNLKQENKQLTEVNKEQKELLDKIYNFTDLIKEYYKNNAITDGVHSISISEDLIKLMDRFQNLFKEVKE